VKYKFLLKSALFITLPLLAIASPSAIGQERPGKPKMQYMGAFDAGQAGASIYKLFDNTEDVVCYILAPDVAGRKLVGGGKWVYDGNNVGSISCLKVRLPVVPINPAVTKK